MDRKPVKKRVPRITKHPSYREAIEYVALNDEPCVMSAKDIMYQPTTQLVNVIFGTPMEEIAQDIIRLRVKMVRRERRLDRMARKLNEGFKRSLEE